MLEQNPVHRDDLDVLFGLLQGEQYEIVDCSREHWWLAKNSNGWVVGEGGLPL